MIMVFGLDGGWMGLCLRDEITSVHVYIYICYIDPELGIEGLAIPGWKRV